MQPAIVRRTAFLLCGMAALQGALILIFHDVFLTPLPANLAQVPPGAWILALAVAAAYVAYSAGALPAVRKHLWNFSTFKLSGLALAVPAAILEEVFFRQYVMDALAHETAIIQILASALTFGIAHAIWGIRGGWRAAAGAVGSTTLMGAASIWHPGAPFCPASSVIFSSPPSSSLGCSMPTSNARAPRHEDLSHPILACA